MDYKAILLTDVLYEAMFCMSIEDSCGPQMCHAVGVNFIMQ